jgi:hypothetical protein
MMEGGGTKVGHGPPPNKEKKIEVKKIKNVKFDSNFSHLAHFQKLFGPIFRFYGHIQSIFFALFLIFWAIPIKFLFLFMAHTFKCSFFWFIGSLMFKK